MSESEPAGSPLPTKTELPLDPAVAIIRPNPRVKIGWGLICLSGLLWAPLPILPFLSLSAGAKVLLGTLLFIGVQISWWSGSVLAGPSAVRAVYGWLKKALWWRKPASGESSQPNG